MMGYLLNDSVPDSTASAAATVHQKTMRWVAGATCERDIPSRIRVRRFLPLHVHLS